MRTRRRSAFSVVELAFAAAGATVALGLLFPFLQSVRAAADRAKCADNLKRIALAVREYESVHNGELIRNLYGPQLGLGDPAHVGSLTLLLPYLGEDPLFRKYNQSVHFCDPVNQVVAKTHLAVFQCPSAPANGVSVPGLALSNPAWQGAMSDYASIRNLAYPVGSEQDPYARGAFEQRFGMNPNVQRRVYSHMIRDGLSNTLGFVERAGVPGVWVKGVNFDDGKGVSAPQTEPRGPWAGYSCINLNTFSADGKLTVPGGPCTVNCRNVVGQYNQGGIYSFHAGGALCSFVDGSVKLLREGLQTDVLHALTSRAGGEVLGDGDY